MIKCNKNVILIVQVVAISFIIPAIGDDTITKTTIDEAGPVYVDPQPGIVENCIEISDTDEAGPVYVSPQPTVVEPFIGPNDSDQAGPVYVSPQPTVVEPFIGLNDTDQAGVVYVNPTSIVIETFKGIRSVLEVSKVTDRVFDINGKALKVNQVSTGIYFTLDKEGNLIKKHIIIK